MEKVHRQIVDDIMQITSFSFDKKINLNSIILVGSNFNIKSLTQIKRNDSDIDILVLTDDLNNSIQKKYNDVLYDISYININDIINIFFSSINGSFFYGKLISAITNYQIIKDTNNIALKFINITTSFYKLFTSAYIPNNSISGNFFHNILANKKDLSKTNFNESFFAYLRLSEHLFNYITYLAYPFIATGSYRGEILKTYFIKNIGLNDEETMELDFNYIDKILNKYCPVLENDFKPVIYNQKIKLLLKNNSLNSFYFNYDNLILEKRIIFLSNNDIVRFNLNTEPLKNIVPFFSENQLNIFHDTLINLSQKYHNEKMKNRKNILFSILNEFKQHSFDLVIVQSLKSIIVYKYLFKLNNDQKRVDFQDFNGLFKKITTLKLITPNLKSDTKKYIPYKIFECIRKSDSKREKEIKVSHIFFDIMKSLKIDIDDLDFNFK